MSRAVSGKRVVSVLTKQFGFTVVSQKGSHVKLKKRLESGDIITIVPMHKELAFGTLRGVLRLARVDYAQFIAAL